MEHGNSKERLDFARRLNQALDNIGTVNKGRGRQAEIAKMFDVTPGAARKWLEGESYPETEKLVVMAKRLNVRFEWLVMGQGPMKQAPTDYKATDINTELLEEVIEVAEQALKKKGMESLSYARRARFFGYLYEEAKKDGRVDAKKVEKLLQFLV